MRKAFAIIGYALLILFVGSVGYISLSKFNEKFGESGLSSTEEWADFATYISGTVGVAAVVATFLALMITIWQQKKLIDSQEKQIEMARDTNQWQFGYEVFKNLLPIHIQFCTEDLEEFFNVGFLLNEIQQGEGDSQLFSDAKVNDLFSNYFFKEVVGLDYKMSEDALDNLRFNYLDKRYGLSLVLVESMKSSHLIKPLVVKMINDNDLLVQVYCALAYRKNINKQEVKSVESIFEITVEQFAEQSSAVKWWCAQGERIFGRAG